MIQTKDDLRKYIEENYIEITDSRINDEHFDLYCETCGLTRGFQVIEKNTHINGTSYSGYSQDFDYPEGICFKCPVCNTYKIWLVYKLFYIEKIEGNTKTINRLYKVTSIPNEGIDDIKELPDKPEALRQAYREAIRAMDANAYLASAAMFRRALQVITREIFKVKPGNLSNELREITGKKLGSTTLTTDFSANSYIIKEAGNQGSHPDNDPDLLKLNSQDATDLKNIFMELVTELFVVPAAIKKTKEEFLKRRKVEVK